MATLPSRVCYDKFHLPGCCPFPLCLKAPAHCAVKAKSIFFPSEREVILQVKESWMWISTGFSRLTWLWGGGGVWHSSGETVKGTIERRCRENNNISRPSSTKVLITTSVMLGYGLTHSDSCDLFTSIKKAVHPCCLYREENNKNSSKDSPHSVAHSGVHTELGNKILIRRWLAS